MITVVYSCSYPAPFAMHYSSIVSFHMVQLSFEFVARQQHPPLHPLPPFPPPISFIPTLTTPPPPPLPAAPAPGPRTPLLRSFKSYFPRSTFSYMRSATSKNAFSTFCPLLADVSTYDITPFLLHHSSASSTVTALWFAASNPCASPFATPEVTVLDEAKSLLLPTSITTIPSSAICLRSCNHAVACSKVDRRVIS